MGFIYLVQVGKYMVVIFTFLSLFWYVFCGKIPPIVQRKGLMSCEKKYVNLCHFDFIFKMLFKMGRVF